MDKTNCATAEALAAANGKPKENIYETPCKTCVFAKYRGDTQYGCAFDRVEKFRRQGIEVIEAFDKQKEFFVIKTVCRAHRDKKSPWAMKNPGSDRKEICRKELTMDFDVVIVMDDRHEVADVEKTIESLKAQTLLPMHVTVVLHRDGVQTNDIRKLLPGDWVVKVVMERTEDGQRVGAGRCIDLSLTNSKSHFYAIFNPGCVVPPTFLEDVDKAINDELERFVLLLPTQAGNGCVVQMRAHRYYGGNAEAEIQGEDAGEEQGQRADSIVDKILHRMRVEDRPHLVKRVSDVCRGMEFFDGVQNSAVGEERLINTPSSV